MNASSGSWVYRSKDTGRIGPDSRRAPRATSGKAPQPAAGARGAIATRWYVSQIGARQHYGVARGFHRGGNLNLLYTDLWSRWGHGLLRRGPTALRAFAGRHHGAIPNSCVVSFNARAALDALIHPRHQESVEKVYLGYLQWGRQFGAAVARDLRRRPINPLVDAFFGFNTACLETLRYLRELNVPTICDQIDPAAVEEEIVHEERQRWAGWEIAGGRIPDAYWARLQQEWSVASMVLVNSRWSRNALIRQGVPREKLFVLPIAYEPDSVHLAPPKTTEQGPLTVLWLGTVMLRKGIAYLMEAARLLRKEHPQVRILVAGRSMLTPKAIESAPPNVQFLGRVTRDQTDDLYRQADLFVLPTLSDGFAITQLEAMAQGLPVITTPNCGDVVSDGEDGFIVPARDAIALADAVAKLDGDRPALREMSRRAVEKSRRFRLEQRADLLEEAVLDYRAGLPLRSVPGAMD